jgi:hypothetical protein
MHRRPALQLVAFSKHTFDAPGEAEALIEQLMRVPFGATRFGAAEPARTPLTGAGRSAAASALRGVEGANYGTIVLAGTKPRMTVLVDWRRDRTSTWHAELDVSMASNPSRREVLVDALADLFTRFPARFAALAPAHCWRARHWHVETFDDGGETHTKVGLDLEGQLPGVFWWTLLGREATSHFGRDALLAAPAAQVLDLGEAGGVVLRAAPCPPEGSDVHLSAAEAALRDHLGSEYFFGIRAPTRRRAVIPGLTGPSAADGRPPPGRPPATEPIS